MIATVPLDSSSHRYKCCLSIYTAVVHSLMFRLDILLTIGFLYKKESILEDTYFYVDQKSYIGPYTFLIFCNLGTIC